MFQTDNKKKIISKNVKTCIISVKYAQAIIVNLWQDSEKSCNGICNRKWDEEMLKIN